VLPLVANALLKLRASNGQLVWSHNPLLLGEITGAPLVDLPRNQVYFATRANTLHAVNATTGAGLWSISLTAGISLLAGVEGALAQGPDGILYAATTQGRLVAVNPAAGIPLASRRLWSRDLGGAAVATPAIGKGSPYMIYVGTQSNELVAVRSNNAVVWRAPTGVPWWQNGDVNASAALSPDGSTVYFGGEHQKLHAVDAATGAERWSFPVTGAIRGGPIVDRAGTVYVATTQGRLYALRPGAGISNAARPYFTSNLGFEVIDSLAMSQDGDLLVTARGIPSLFVVRR
jgi:outer membrane protein assembly factor BamB